MRAILANTWALILESVKGFLADNALSRSAAISFYATTSLAPVLLIVIAVAGLVVGKDAAQLALSAQLSGLLGPTSAELLDSVVRGAANTTSGIVAGTVASLTLMVTASGVFGEMQSSLNQIWKVQAASANLSALVRARLASLGLVASLGFLLLVSLAASAAISTFSDALNSRLPFSTLVIATINTLISITLTAVLFAAIYKVLPDRSLTWRDVGFGAVVTAVLFTIGKSLIGWYLGTSAVASSYGAAGSLILLLLWVFYSSATFLLGAEITRAYAVRYGTRSDIGRNDLIATRTELGRATALRNTSVFNRTGIIGVALISASSALIATIAFNMRRGR